MRWAREDAPGKCGEVGEVVVVRAPRGAGVKYSEAKVLKGETRQKKTSPGEHDVSRKDIAQGRPECSSCTLSVVCNLVLRNRPRSNAGLQASTRFPAKNLKVLEGTNDRRQNLWHKRARREVVLVGMG